MILTHENYHSFEANQEYLSNSQYHDFCGTLGRRGCEERALAIINGKYEQVTTIPMLVGSFVDAHFSGELDIFRGKNPEIYTQEGVLRSPFKKAEAVIRRIESDDFFMKFMNGEPQVILTGEMFGAKWKIKIDVFHRAHSFVDLKVMRSLTEMHRVKDHGYVTFVEFWGIDHQGAIYQEIIKKNIGKQLIFFIAGASKENEIDIEIINIDNQTLRAALLEIECNMSRILDLKAGKVLPDRCGLCDYCKATKILTKVIHYSDLGKKI